MQSWQSGGERSVSAPILSPAVCAVIPRCSRRGEPRLERALVQSWQSGGKKTGCVCLGKERNGCGGTPPRHGTRSCLRWGCAPCPTAPGVINHHPVGAGLQSWQSGGERSVSAPILSPAVCAVIPRCSRRGEPRPERALVQSWQNSAEKPVVPTQAKRGTGAEALRPGRHNQPDCYCPARQRNMGAEALRPGTGPVTFRLSWTKERSPRSADTGQGKPG